MTTRNLEPDQWRNREEWRLVSGRRQQLLKCRIDKMTGEAASADTVAVTHYVGCDC